MNASQQIWLLLISAEVILLLLVQILSARWRKRYTKIGAAVLLITCTGYFLHPVGYKLRSKRGSENLDISDVEEMNLENEEYFNQGLLESDDYHEERREIIRENFIIPWSFGNILSMADDDDSDDDADDSYVTEYDVYASYAKLFQNEQNDFYVVEEDPFITEFLKMNNNPKIRLVAAHQMDSADDPDGVAMPTASNYDDGDEIYKYEDAL